MNAKISIAMATYNGEMYLHDQFDSILAQSFTDWELVDSELNDLGTDLFSTQKYEIIPDNKEDWFFFLMHGNIFQGAAMLFKKNLLNKALPIPD